MDLLRGVRATDELKCRSGHLMKQLPFLPESSKSAYLNCEVCLKAFRSDTGSYGCSDCDIDICYDCLQHLPATVTRLAPRRLEDLGDVPLRSAPKKKTSPAKSVTIQPARDQQYEELHEWLEEHSMSVKRALEIALTALTMRQQQAITARPLRCG